MKKKFLILGAVLLCLTGFLTAISYFVKYMRMKPLDNIVYDESVKVIPKAYVKNNTILDEFEAGSMQLLGVKDDYIFIGMASEIYRYNLNNDELKKLTDKVSLHNLIMHNEWLVISPLVPGPDNSDDIKIINGITGETKPLNVAAFERTANVKNGYFKIIMFNQERIFYIDYSTAEGIGLSMYNIAEDTVTSIAKMRRENINADDDNIYWIDENEINIYNITGDSLKRFPVPYSSAYRITEPVLHGDSFYFFINDNVKNDRKLCKIDVTDNKVKEVIDFNGVEFMEDNGIWFAPLRQTLLTGFVYESNKIFISNHFRIIKSASGFGALGYDLSKEGTGIKGLVFISDEMLQRVPAG